MTAVTTAASPRKRRGHLRRHAATYSVIALLLLLGASALFAYLTSRSSADQDGRARDAAVAAYAKQLQQETEGAIVIHIHQGDDDYENEYYWNSDAHTLRARFSLGACDGLYGAFIEMPTRPKDAQEIGPFVIELKGKGRRSASALVSANDPTLYDKLLASTLEHCIAGDTRLMPRSNR